MSEIESIIKWLTSYPDFSATFDVSREGTGQLIDFLGTEILETNFFVRIGYVERRRNDYILEVRKPFLELLQRKRNADFLSNLQKWVASQSNLGHVPLLGNHGRQKAWVDAQQYVDMDDSDETALYQVQMHIEYSVFE